MLTYLIMMLVVMCRSINVNFIRFHVWNHQRSQTRPFIFQQVEDIQYHMEVPPLVYYLLLAVYLPLVSLGIIFNLTLLSVILSTRKLRVDPRNSFIVALAFSDLSLCFFTSPLTLWYTLEGHWPLGKESYTHLTILAHNLGLLTTVYFFYRKYRETLFDRSRIRSTFASL